MPKNMGPSIRALGFRLQVTGTGPFIVFSHSQISGRHSASASGSNSSRDLQMSQNRDSSSYGIFHKLRVLFWGALHEGPHKFGSIPGAPDFWKLPYGVLSRLQEDAPMIAQQFGCHALGNAGVALLGCWGDLVSLLSNGPYRACYGF